MINITQKQEVLSNIITSNTAELYGHKKERMFSYIYSFVIFLVTIVSVSMLALSVEQQSKYPALFSIIEIVVFLVLAIDLILRWITSPVRLKKGKWSYLIFPFSLSGLMLLASLMPSLYLINVWSDEHIRAFTVFEDMKFLRIFRMIMLANLVPGLSIFRAVLLKEKWVLYIVFSVVIAMILIFALVIYDIETSDNAVKQFMENWNKIPGNQKIDLVKAEELLPIQSFWDSLYFSTVSLTTIGFGDIHPITLLGKNVTIIMSILGIAVLATPSGVIAGGFISEVRAKRKVKDEATVSKNKAKK